MTHLDEKARRAAIHAAHEIAADGAPVPEYVDGILRAYLSALLSPPVSELVEALLEWSKPDTGSHDAGVQLVCEQAATTLTTLSTRIAELEREVKRLREATEELRVERDHFAEIGSKAISFRISENIFVESRGAGAWVVTSGGRSVLNSDGDWEFEPMPSSRTDEFIARTRFSFSDAWTLSTAPQGGEHE